MKSILIIEDEPQIRSGIQEVLNLSKYETAVAPNGLVGINIAQDILPDLIICDVCMPELDGHDVIRILRKDQKTANIPFIFLTAQVEHDERRKGMELGAADYLSKPFKPDELLRVVNLQLAKQNARDRQTDTKLNLLRHNINLALPHELHTPLNGILGSAELLIRDGELMAAGDRVELAKQIRDSALRLYRLTQNFLLYADLEVRANGSDVAQTIQINRHQRSSSQRVIQQMAEDVSKRYHRSVDLHLDLQDQLLPISEQKLGKVIEELIDNAFKFSPKGTPIYVIGRTVEGHYHFDVVDMGRGMTAEQIAQFGAYMQFDRQRYEQQGSGLGLIIAKRIVELYGGHMTIRSIPQQETIVHFTLPLKASA
jgi:two-component system, sensor histidine kinase and response regulator